MHATTHAQVLRTKNAHPMAKAACVAVLNALLRRSPPEGCEAIAVGQGALEPLAAVFLHPVVPLVYKAHAAGGSGMRMPLSGCECTAHEDYPHGFLGCLENACWYTRGTHAPAYVLHGHF